MLGAEEILEFSRYKQKGFDKETIPREKTTWEGGQQQWNPARNQEFTDQKFVFDLAWVMSVRGITERCELG